MVQDQRSRIQEADADYHDRRALLSRLFRLLYMLKHMVMHMASSCQHQAQASVHAHVHADVSVPAHVHIHWAMFMLMFMSVTSCVLPECHHLLYKTLHMLQYNCCHFYMM